MTLALLNSLDDLRRNPTASFRVTVYANSDAISSKLVPAVIGKAEAASNAWNMIIAEELIQIKKRVGGVGALSSQCEPSSGRLLRGPDRLQRSASVAPSREEIPEPFLPASCIPRDQAPASSALPRAFFSAPARPAPERDSLVSGQFVLSGDLRWNRLLRNSTVFSVPRESCFLGLRAFVVARSAFAPASLHRSQPHPGRSPGERRPAVMHHGIGFSSPLSTPVTQQLPNPRGPISITNVELRLICSRIRDE